MAGGPRSVAQGQPRGLRIGPKKKGLKRGEVLSPCVNYRNKGHKLGRSSKPRVGYKGGGPRPYPFLKNCIQHIIPLASWKKHFLPCLIR